MSHKRLSVLEEKLCRLVGVDSTKVQHTRPKALLVGESPPRNSPKDCPLFPHPVNSAGWRLWKYSGLKMQEYLEIFQRINIVDECPQGRWPADEAAERARAIIASAATLEWPIVLCGLRVARAFGVDLRDPGRMIKKQYPVDGRGVLNTILYRIPYPSGRSLVLNDAEQRALVATVLKHAAGIRDAFPPD